jgi:hypothetical protein
MWVEEMLFSGTLETHEGFEPGFFFFFFQFCDIENFAKFSIN